MYFLIKRLCFEFLHSVTLWNARKREKKVILKHFADDCSLNFFRNQKTLSLYIYEQLPVRSTGQTINTCDRLTGNRLYEKEREIRRRANCHEHATKPRNQCHSLYVEMMRQARRKNPQCHQKQVQKVLRREQAPPGKFHTHQSRKVRGTWCVDGQGTRGRHEY